MGATTVSEHGNGAVAASDDHDGEFRATADPQFQEEELEEEAAVAAAAAVVGKKQRRGPLLW